MPDKDIPKPSGITIAEEIIRNSGNSFHFKVVKALRDLGWSVAVSPYYNDGQTDRSREIDIIAEKGFMANSWSEEKLGTINIRLFIECKYVLQETVFWFDEKDVEKAEGRVVSSTPLRSRLENSAIDAHRYLSRTKVAKLFASKTAKSQENDPFYKAINQSLSGLIYRERGSAVSSSDARFPAKILMTASYPVIICNSFERLFAAYPDNFNTPVAIEDNFQVEINYAYMSADRLPVNDYFLIDIISLGNLESFIENLIATDISAFRDFYHNQSL